MTTLQRWRPVHHNLDIYDAVLHLVSTVAQYERVCTELAGPDGGWRPWHSVGQVQTFHSGDGTDGLPEFHVVICMDGRVLTHEDTQLGDRIRLSAHEATHAAGLILDHAGQEYDGVSEAQAYLVAWLTEWIWQHLPTT